MFRRLRLSSSLFAAALIAIPGANAETPKLVLQLTVDGLRADMVQRYAENFARGGFKRLLEDGLLFTNARYLHANTETIVGHTTLATGATPAVHGMVGNVWYNADTGELGYNIEDPEAPLLPTATGSEEGWQLDPAQLRAGTKGRSPRGILVPTFSDTLVLATAGKSRNFAVSGKDRSAVAMSGKSGIAYWYSTDNGHFQTSSYYMDRYPEWVQRWNAKETAAALAGSQWALSLPRHRYRFGNADDRPYEMDLKGYGRTFPHTFGSLDHPMFFSQVLVSPESDVMVADFGKKLIAEEGLGVDDVPDYLSLSFSGVDAVNHFFGPSSLENEESVIRLDRTLADLFDYVDKEIGLEHTLVVLSADHGMPEMPEYASELGYPAERLSGAEVLAAARRASEAGFGDAELVKDFFRPYLYLDHGKLRSSGLDKQEVVKTLAAALAGTPGIGVEIPDSGNTRVSQAVLHNHHPQRSGDIYVYQQPYWFLVEGSSVATMHGSPWEYDRHVPIMFMGESIPKGLVTREVHPSSVAPTLSALLGILAPAGAVSPALVEVLDD